LPSADSPEGGFGQQLRAARRDLVLSPADTARIGELAAVAFRCSWMPAAADLYSRLLALEPAHAGAHASRANALRFGAERRKADRHVRAALALAGDVRAAELLAQTLWESGRTAEARTWYGRALAIEPTDARSRLGDCIARVPIVYRQEAEIDAARAAYAEGLATLERWSAGAPPQELARFADAVGSIQPFFLAYQNRDDRPLQASYGRLVCRALASRHPDLAAPPRRRQRIAGERLRVGLVSGYFRSHSVWKMALGGWVLGLDRGRVSLLGYHTGTVADEITAEARRSLDGFTDGIHDRASFARRIRDDRLDALLYPEIGMDPVAAWLAGLRLAPVQAMSWGHPTTSGYPTIDYFLSSALMEPADGDRHYTEALVRLPGLGCLYSPTRVKPAALRRADIGAEAEDVLYLCAQSLFKYLPGHDAVLVKIADAVPRARFVFYSGTLETVAQAMFERLAGCFVAAGHDPGRRLIRLPGLTEAGFLGVGRLADILLDSIGWSGFNTTIEVIDSGVPVVCLAGPYMRGRHTAAALTAIGLSDMISADRCGYAERAIRLGLDRVLRGAERLRLGRAVPRLYGDAAPIRTLEAFLDDVCR
jgi:predicted O-linked N-acetylglucosamine transferase (SPINDLY family)